MLLDMSYYAITEPIVQLFVGVDQRNWELASQSFAPEVLLDYSSMGGGAAQTLSPQKIMASWQAVLPGFEYTHHQLGNFLIQMSGEIAQVSCYGTATHYLSEQAEQEVWAVIGTYDFTLQKDAEQWKIHQMKFNFKYQSGNTQLLALAQERVKAS